LHKENEIIVNRQLKDSLFTHLFKDIKYLKKLYSALYDDADSYEDEDFKLITLENTLVYDIYNDLGLLVKDKFILLVEAQSGYNPNMAVRLLIYIANSYYNYIFDNSLNIYGTKKIELPKPEFILIYTGTRKFESDVLRLSDSYCHKYDITLELIVKIITADTVRNNIISEYISFCQKYDSLREGLTSKDDIFKALVATIDYCKGNDILKEFLETKEREVMEVMMGLFTQEQATNMILKERYNEGRLEGERKGRLEGRLEGIQEKTVSIAKAMKEQNFHTDMIISITGLSKEEIDNL